MCAAITKSIDTAQAGNSLEIIGAITELTSLLVDPKKRPYNYWIRDDSDEPFTVQIKRNEEGDAVRFFIMGSSIYNAHIIVCDEFIVLTHRQRSKYIEITDTVDTVSKVVAWLVKLNALCLPFDLVVNRYGKYVSPIWYLKRKLIPAIGYKHKIANRFSDFLLSSHGYDKRFPDLGYYYEIKYQCF